MTDEDFLLGLANDHLHSVIDARVAIEQNISFMSDEDRAAAIALVEEIDKDLAAAIALVEEIRDI